MSKSERTISSPSENSTDIQISNLPQPYSLQLEDRPTKPVHLFNWFQWWPAAIFPPAYALHRYYRRYRPRRLPPFTPLSLPGLYGVSFITTMGIVHQVLSSLEVWQDKRLHILEHAGTRAAALPDDPKKAHSFNAISVTPDLALSLKKIRDSQYNSSGLLGKFAWWEHHMWSSPDVYNRWAILLLSKLQETQSVDAFSTKDLDICTTHLANSSTGRYQRVSEALEWGLILPIPFAMLARWSARKAFYMPMNCLQRLIIAAWMYVELPVGFRYYDYLKGIRAKSAAAQLMIDIFGDFDEELKEMGFEYK